MKAMFSKKIAACSVVLASLFAGNAYADIYNPYTVQRPGTSGEANQFVADKMVAGYTEVISFDGTGGFNVSLYFKVNGFWTNNGGTSVNNSGLGGDDGYGLYGTYAASGTVSTVGGISTFTFTPGADSTLSFWLDRNNDTGKTDPTLGTGSFAFSNTGDDTRLAGGTGIFGTGTLLPGSACEFTAFCGGFGSRTTLDLTNAGHQFFIEPKPFYTISLQTGQLNTFEVTGTQTITGSLDIMFNTPGEVPEPASVGLLGLGLLGLGAARRRKQAK